MTRQPWMKWYPADWRADPGLRMCSFAARGLWADLLSLMHEADPYGHLLVNGVSPSTKQLAALLGGPEREVTALLAELEASGVFSRAPNGEVMSRRMVRDAKKREEDKANGKRGGNPSLKEGVNPTVPPQDKAQKPETREPEGIADSARALASNEVSPEEEGELFAVAGKALSSSPNLFVMAVPMGWKSEGMDWLLDVIPAVRTTSQHCQPGSVKSWKYFSQSVADWHAKRITPMPIGNVNGRTQNAPRRTTATVGRELAEEFRRREAEDERGDGARVPALVGISRTG